MKCCAARFAVLGSLALLFSTGASAHEFIIDQSHESVGGLRNFQSIRHQAPVGQEFRPTFSRLDVVELVTEDFDMGLDELGVGGMLLVNIREATITGPIVGTSSLVSLPDHWGQFFGDPDPFDPGAVTHFDFPAPVPLVPDNLYVLEVVHASGDNFGVLTNGGFPDPLVGPPYLRGRVVILGVPADTDGFDMWFRIGAVPEPSSGLLFGVACLLIEGWRRLAASAYLGYPTGVPTYRLTRL